MKKFLIGCLVLFFSTTVNADTITPHTVYGATSQVTNVTLNGNVNAITGQVNGNLNNDNAKTSSGFRFYEVLSAAPSATTEGRAYNNTTGDTWNWSNGTSFITAVDTSNAQTVTGIKTFSAVPVFSAGLNAGDSNIINVGDIALDSLTPDGTTIVVNDDGSDGVVMEMNDDSTNDGLYLHADVEKAVGKYLLHVVSTVDQDNAVLSLFHQANVDSAESCMKLDNDGPGWCLDMEAVSATSAAHFKMNPVATVVGSTEGEVYADGDASTEIMYYRSGSAWAACNADNDFAEVMECEGKAKDYETGEVIIIGTEYITKGEYESGLKDKAGKNVKKRADSEFSDTTTKVTKSSSPYQKGIVGVFSDRGGFILDKTMHINDSRIVVGLIGLVKCRVTNENGAIVPGDLLTSSSTAGVAMKATPTTFSEYSACIGKAREASNKVIDVIEILVGVK